MVRAMPRLRAHHWLATLPAAAILVGVPFANRVRGYVMGLPFLLFWIVACVLATSAVMAVIGVLDRRDGGSQPETGPDGPKDEHP